VRQMYAGLKTPAGVPIYPGLSRGSESGWDRLWSDPKKLGGSWLEFYRFMVFQNPSWDLSMLDFDRDPSVAEQKVGQVLNPTNPDLSGFAKRGGKIIIYHGWADDMVPSQVSTDYYDSVNSKLGPKQLEEFYRLFMVPGMWHCSGPDVLFRSEDAVAIPLEQERDMLTALEQWVEQNRAPNSFVASRLNKDGTIERTHLLCAIRCSQNIVVKEMSCGPRALRARNEGLDSDIEPPVASSCEYYLPVGGCSTMISTQDGYFAER